MNRQQQRKTYKLTWQEIDKLIKDNYKKGFQDGVEVGNDADFKIRLVQVLSETKGVGKTILDRAIRINKEMES